MFVFSRFLRLLVGVEAIAWLFNSMLFSSLSEKGIVASVIRGGFAIF